MNDKYIGVFDSGLGGLTTVKELMKVLPEENIIYFGDTARVPYGTKSDSVIIKYVRSDVNFLKSFDIKMIIVACGTASSVALPVIKDECGVPIIGVVSPTVRAALGATRNNRIAVLGTNTTINSGKYESEIKSLSPDTFVFNKACPLFVPIVENGCIDDEIARLVCKKYLDEVIESGADTVILGCTHYPILERTISKILGGKVRLINSGAETADYTKRYLAQNDMLCSGRSDRQYRYYVSDSAENFSSVANIFLDGHFGGDIQKINIENYGD